MKLEFDSAWAFAWQKLHASKKIILFGMVGTFGTVLNTALLFIFTFYAGFHYLISSALATEIAIISNFTGNHLLTFNEKLSDTGIYKKFIIFQMISITTIIGTLSILWVLTSSFGIGYLLVWNFFAIFVMFLFNYALNKRFTWNSKWKNKQSSSAENQL